MTLKKKEIDLSKNLQKLSEIADWFDNQKEIDVEGGLEKVREAGVLIKESRGRLGEIENEFEEIKKDIEKDVESELVEEEKEEVQAPFATSELPF